MEDLKRIAGALVIGTVIGTAIGGAIGVLFAPDKGSNTRKKLMTDANEFAKDLKEKVKKEAAELNHTV